ncbi:major coat protein [Vibrio phage VSK]|uniref:Major coat protein n=1 Tax=Vibrio phage VSK TaxID=181604 RepID=Q8SDJ2_9VIRU|nr:major coat protein [Vibrio phage VSK]AAL76098.2 major coat protein [Vibrio phage VSK]
MPLCKKFSLQSTLLVSLLSLLLLVLPSLASTWLSKASLSANALSTKPNR